MCSQGEVVFQQGVENRVVSADLLLFCSFSSSASSLPERERDEGEAEGKRSMWARKQRKFRRKKVWSNGTDLFRKGFLF